jgi:formylglycine-generating enzyme required for sulfatase activity
MQDRTRRPPKFPPPFASAWGDDAYGLWAEFEILSVNSTTPVAQRMRWIEPGEFLMGSPDSETERSNDEGPQHPVRISQGFWLADTACTQALWQAVMASNPSRFTGDEQRPVEQVSWRDVQEFLAKIETLDAGCRMTLPTEAQWEYACRAGTFTPFSLGENITPEQVNYDGNYPYPARKGGYREQTVPVKTLPGNTWGLYEMHGNIFEWCADGIREYMQEAVTDPAGPMQDGSASRAVRGGSWNNLAWHARSAFRRHYGPVFRLGYLGFRLCSRSQEPAGTAGPGARGMRAGGNPEGQD